MELRPEQPPEGKLIADALARAGLSIREASRRAGISYGRWRQIASGVQNVSPGSYGRVRAPAKTLAKMARVVGVTPDELHSTGREDAAAELQAFLDAPPRASIERPSFDDPAEDRLAAQMWDTAHDDQGAVFDEARLADFITRTVMVHRQRDTDLPNGESRRAAG
jgi:hypothetical protein